MGGGGGEAGKVDLEHGTGEIQAARQFQGSPPLPNIKFHLKVEMLSLCQTEAFLVVQTVKESACDARDPGSIPGAGRYPWRKWNVFPLQNSCLENSMDRGTWWVMVQGVAKSPTQLRD